MKNNYLFIIGKFLGLLVVVVLLFSCEDDNSSSKRNNKTDESNLNDTYISINISMEEESLIRSNPTGGEDGDGEEDGLENENTITDLTVILFQTNDINSSLTTEAAEVLYFTADDIENNTTIVKKLKLDKDIYQVLAVVNAGNLYRQFSERTVVEVCNYIQQTAWTNQNGIYSNFVMSSASASILDLTVSTSEENPAVATVNVQRMAARIDVIPNQGLNNSNQYSVVEGTQVTAYVNLEAVKLMNTLTAGSYIMKRVADDINGTPEYLGVETPVSGNQTNYVIDPWTSVKTIDNLTGSHFDIVNGGVGTSPASALYSNYFNESFTLDNSNAIQSPLSGEDFYILGYTLENTMGQDYQVNGYSTGVMYRTTYIPAQITNYNPATFANQVINNSTTITFFTSSNNEVIYNSLEAVEATFLNGIQENDFFAQSFTSSNTWQDLQNYSTRIKDQDILGFKAYLNGLLSGKVLTDNMTVNVSWSAFVLSNYGYSRSGAIVSINQNGLNTAELLKEVALKTYENGICYYPYWIRHSNNNTIESGIMEFGIVRNNIYKLRVVSFSGLGKPEPYDPDIDNPENPDEESYIQVLIYVKPWRLITHPEIVL